ncbi:hypothetical protein M9458_050250, partial [Cirrhinus mrigala]
MSKVSPGAPLQTAHPLCSPVKLPDDFDSLSQYGLDLLFKVPVGEEEVTAASEGGHEPFDAEALSELSSLAAEFQVVADAEMATTWSKKETCIGTPLVFPHVLKHRIHSDDLPGLEEPLTGSCQTSSVSKTPSGRGFSPPATGCFVPTSHNPPTP